MNDETRKVIINLKKVKDLSYWTNWKEIKNILNETQFTKKEMVLSFLTVSFFTYFVFSINLYIFFIDLFKTKEVAYWVYNISKIAIMASCLYILLKRFKFLFPYKDLKTRKEKTSLLVRSVSNTYTLSGVLTFIAVYLQIPFFTEVKTTEVQDVAKDFDINAVSNMSLSFLFDLPLEEFLCLLMFFFFYKIFSPKTNNAILISVLLSSLIFGIWHLNYNEHTVLPIAFSRIAFFIMLFVYKDILGLIIAHYLNDVLFLIGHLKPEIFNIPMEIFHRGIVFILIYIGISSFVAKFMYTDYYQNLRISAMNVLIKLKLKRA